MVCSLPTLKSVFYISKRLTKVKCNAAFTVIESFCFVFVGGFSSFESFPKLLQFNGAILRSEHIRSLKAPSGAIAAFAIA